MSKVINTNSVQEDNSADGMIIGNIPGTIPNPIPKKFVKKASGGQPAAKQQTEAYSVGDNVHYIKGVIGHGPARFEKMQGKISNVVHSGVYQILSKSKKLHTVRHASITGRVANEEVTGFADASAPSNSNYQTQLSPTKTAKKMSKKKLKEYYQKNIVELAKVCPECNNTGVVRKFGNNVLCTSCGGDARSDNPKIIGKQAKDMLTTGRTTPVAESGQGVPDNQYGKFLDQRKEHNKGHKFQKDCPDCKEAKRKGKNPETYRFNEDVITCLEDIYPILEAYKASPKMLSRVKYNVHPKLSKMLRDRLAARKPKSKGYKASQGTLGLAAARRAQMSHSKEKSPKGYPEEVSHLGSPSVADSTAHKKAPVSPVKEEKKKSNYSARVQGKMLASLSAKPIMGSSNDNRVSEEHDKHYELGHSHGYQHLAPIPPSHPKHAESYNEGYKTGKFDRSEDDINEGISHGMSKAAHAADVAQSDREYIAERQWKKKRPEKCICRSDKKENDRCPVHSGMKEEKVFEKSNSELKKFTGGSNKTDIKRKYLGAARGRTATGKPAHPIEVDPIIKVSTDINKVVK
jgi:hypothetical protein